MTDPQRRESTPLAHIEWRWKAFGDLTTSEVYAMLAARSEVFVVEQNCVYADIDGLDKDAWHLFAYGIGETVPKLAGYLRVLLPDGAAAAAATATAAAAAPAAATNAVTAATATNADVRIGRVLTSAAFRGIGLGNAMLERALAQIAAQWPGTPVRLHAQAHLQAFYGAFGFRPISEIHDEDGIAHVWMRSA